jgi:hypothetical protein
MRQPGQLTAAGVVDPLTLMSGIPKIYLDPNDLEVDVPAQHGFFGPRSVRGSAALLPEPPWYYSGDLLTVEYRVNPDRVLELLPGPLELAPDDPGAVAFIWADWQSCAADKAQLLDPVLGQYKEAFVVVRCSYRGETYSRCVYIWVDSDFAIARGLHQGYEIIATASASAEGGPAFRARVDGFGLFPAPTEELDRLAPEEIISGYYRQVGVVWDGGRLLHDNLAAPEPVPAEVTEHV